MVSQTELRRRTLLQRARYVSPEPAPTPLTTTEEQIESQEEAEKRKQIEAEISRLQNQQAEYETQRLAFQQAQKLYRKAQEGKNPYISQQTPLVRKYYMQIQAGQEVAPVGASVSESILKELKERAKGKVMPSGIRVPTEESKLAQETLSKITGYIPQREIEAQIKAKEMLAKGTGMVISESEAKRMGLSEAQRKLYTILPSDVTPTEAITISKYIPTYAPPTKTQLFLATPKEKYLRAEKWARKEITYPIAEKIYEKTGLTIPETEKLAEQLSIMQMTTPLGISGITPPLYPPTPFMKRKAEFEAGFVRGTLTGIKEKPIKTAGLFAVSYAIPPTIALSGWGARAVGVSPVITTAGGKILKYAGIGAVSLYGAGKGTQIYRTPDWGMRGRIVGEAVTTEIAPIIAGNIFGSRLATRIYSKELIHNQIKDLSKKDQAKFKEYLEEIKRIEKTGHPKLKEVTLEGMDRIPTKARNPTLKYLRTISKQGDVLGGSVAGRTQTYGVKRSYAQSDLDLYTKLNPNLRANQYANILRNAGIDRVSVVSNTGRVTIRGVKVAEWHSFDAYVQNIYQAEGWYKPVKTTYTKSPEGINVMKISSQAKRKLIGSYLQGRYAKDYPDFKKIMKSLETTYKIQTGEKFDYFKADAKPDFIKKIPPSQYKTRVLYPSYEYPTYYKPYAPVTYPLYPYAPTKYAPVTYPLITKAPPVIFPYATRKPPKRITPFPTLAKKPLKPLIQPYKPIQKIPKVFAPPIKEPYKPIQKIPSMIYPIEKIKGKIKKEKLEEETGKSWDVYGKPIKQKKYVKLNSVPLSKRNAKALGSYLTDHSLSTNWELRENPNPPKKPKLKVPEGYFEKTFNKWREYRIRKGIKYPTPMHFIEKRGAPRLDTRSEINKITLLKKLAEVRAKSKPTSSNEFSGALERVKKNPNIINQFKNKINDIPTPESSSSSNFFKSNSNYFSNKKSKVKEKRKSSPSSFSSFNFFKKPKTSKKSNKMINWFS